MLLIALQKLENEIAAMMQECYETRDALSLSEYGKNVKSLLTGINQLILNIKSFDKNSNFKLSNAISELRKNNEAYWFNSKPALSKVATIAYPTTCVIGLWTFLALTISCGSAILPAAFPVCIGYLVISGFLIHYMQCKVEDNRTINQVLNTINESEQAQQLRTAEVDSKKVFDELSNKAVLTSFPALAPVLF